jgi:hypothetical protein
MEPRTRQGLGWCFSNSPETREPPCARPRLRRGDGHTQRERETQTRHGYHRHPENTCVRVDKGCRAAGARMKHSVGQCWMLPICIEEKVQSSCTTKCHRTKLCWDRAGLRGSSRKVQIVLVSRIGKDLLLCYILEIWDLNL